MSVNVCGCAQCSAMWLNSGESQTGTLTMVGTTSPSLITPVSLPPVMSATAVVSTISSNPYVRGVQFGTQWSGDIRYTFPTGLSNYESDYGDPTALAGF